MGNGPFYTLTLHRLNGRCVLVKFVQQTKHYLGPACMGFWNSHLRAEGKTRLRDALALSRRRGRVHATNRHNHLAKNYAIVPPLANDEGWTMVNPLRLRELAPAARTHLHVTTIAPQIRLFSVMP